MKIDIFHTAHTYDIIYADPPWAYLWGTGKAEALKLSARTKGSLSTLILVQ